VGRSATLEYLGWLHERAAKDPVAKRLLDSAQEDMLTLTTAAREVGDTAIPASCTVELDSAYQQLRLGGGGLATVGPFEPGTADLDAAL
jgi:hypothetical protein